jgi:4-hydroxy-3-polyprenylbenzoate decarboxylase
MRLIVGITGASGLMHGIRILQMLRESKVESHLVLSQAARVALVHECDLSVAEVLSLAAVHHHPGDISASIASGSFLTNGMIVAPCSVKSLAEIATGVTNSLLTRAADVVLKERRRLVLMVRETPLHLGHIRNMATVTEMGAIVYPPAPAFYLRPKTIDEMIDHTAGRILDLFGIAPPGLQRWGEETDPTHHSNKNLGN